MKICTADMRVITVAGIGAIITVASALAISISALGRASGAKRKRSPGSSGIWKSLREEVKAVEERIAELKGEA